MRLLRNGSLLVLLAVWLAGGAAFAADGDKFAEPSLGDFPAELRAAQKAGKAGVMLMFEVADCPYCVRMKRKVLSRDDVQTYFHKHFAVLSVDALGDASIIDFAGHETTEKAYARALKIRGMPSFVIFGLDGGELARFAGVARDSEEFMQLGRYVVDGHYKSLPLERYSRTTQPGKK